MKKPARKTSRTIERMRALCEPEERPKQCGFAEMYMAKAHDSPAPLFCFDLESGTAVISIGVYRMGICYFQKRCGLSWESLEMCFQPTDGRTLENAVFDAGLKTARTIVVRVRVFVRKLRRYLVGDLEMENINLPFGENIVLGFFNQTGEMEIPQTATA